MTEILDFPAHSLPFSPLRTPPEKIHSLYLSIFRFQRLYLLLGGRLLSKQVQDYPPSVRQSLFPIRNPKEATLSALRAGGHRGGDGWRRGTKGVWLERRHEVADGSHAAVETWFPCGQFPAQTTHRGQNLRRRGLTKGALESKRQYLCKNKKYVVADILKKKVNDLSKMEKKLS